MKKVSITILICLFLLTACAQQQQQYALNVAKTIPEIDLLKKRFNEVSLVVASKKDNFNAEDWKELETIGATINLLIDKVNKMTTPEAILASVADLRYMWGLSSDAYTRGRDIVIANKDTFSPAEIAIMSMFDEQANVTGIRIKELLDNPDNANITEALTLIASVASLAIKIVIPLVTAAIAS